MWPGKHCSKKSEGGVLYLSICKSLHVWDVARPLASGGLEKKKKAMGEPRKGMGEEDRSLDLQRSPRRREACTTLGRGVQEEERGRRGKGGGKKAGS